MKKECIPGTPGLNSIKTFCGACLFNQHFIKAEALLSSEYPKLYYNFFDRELFEINQFENFKLLAFLYNCFIIIYRFLKKRVFCLQ
jgi:hypothetical protein